MACTRINNDECRIVKHLQQQTGECRYVMNVPGNGTKPYYIEDPYIRIQKWGGNLMTNAIDLESSLLGVNRKIGKDCLGKEEYTKFNSNSNKISYPETNKLTTEQARAVAPAWEVLDKEQNNFDYLFHNPQENVCLPFHNNLSTRILEKDYFTPKRDCLFDMNKKYDVPVSTMIKSNDIGLDSICSKTNSCSKLN